MTTKEYKNIAKQSVKERFEQEYPNLDYQIGKQKICKSNKSLQIETEIIIKKQILTFSDSW